MFAYRKWDRKKWLEGLDPGANGMSSESESARDGIGVRGKVARWRKERSMAKVIQECPNVFDERSVCRKIDREKMRLRSTSPRVSQDD